MHILMCQSECVKYETAEKKCEGEDRLKWL